MKGSALFMKELNSLGDPHRSHVYLNVLPNASAIDRFLNFLFSFFPCATVKGVRLLTHSRGDGVEQEGRGGGKKIIVAPNFCMRASVWMEMSLAFFLSFPQK